MKTEKYFIVFELKNGIFVQASVRLDLIKSARDVKESLERSCQRKKTYEIFEITK